MSGLDLLTSQCEEILLLIFLLLDGKSIARLCQTCRRLYRICTFDEQLWSQMCWNDFEIHLGCPEPFSSFKQLYHCLRQSREVLMFYLTGDFQEFGIHCRYGNFPNWLWPWIVLNTNPPFLPKWIRRHSERFLPYKLSELSLGKILKIWNLQSSDLPRRIITRMEHGTTYYGWRDIHVAAMRVHGGSRGLQRFMMKKCWRARGYLDRTFQRLHRNNVCQNEVGESSHTAQNVQISKYYGSTQETSNHDSLPVYRSPRNPEASSSRAQVSMGNRVLRVQVSIHTLLNFAQHESLQLSVDNESMSDNSLQLEIPNHANETGESSGNMIDSTPQISYDLPSGQATADTLENVQRNRLLSSSESSIESSD